MCVLSIKVPIRKKSGNLSYAPRTFGKSMAQSVPTSPDVGRIFLALVEQFISENEFKAALLGKKIDLVPLPVTMGRVLDKHLHLMNLDLYLLDQNRELFKINSHIYIYSQGKK